MDVLLVILLLLQAQSLTYEVRYYQAGATLPFQSMLIQSGMYQCNQNPLPTTINTNPTTLEWDDPNASGRKCIYVESVGGPLLSFPAGNYEGTLVAINNFGASPESNRSPFVRGSIAGTPTGFRVVR